jgi:large subunit ribosomal protein L1
MAKLGKRSTAAKAAFAGKDLISVEDAVTLIKGAATAKFDETVEIALNLGVDPRHARRGAIAERHGQNGARGGVCTGCQGG